jgi:hypothetical protein
MKKASEYRRHAEECRQLARSADREEHRELLINMAATWEALADERERMVAKQPQGQKPPQVETAPKRTGR